ncbi:MAG TPA: NAD(P)-dependent oxidoreductase [Candidatus Binatia bacterium]|nr:NAD(P)-dependent oxidoreductase [Candidatus Binatia bacterium]
MANPVDEHRIGFIGLGNIGGAIAANLVADGHALAVHDVDPARVRPLADAGARAAGSPAAVAAESDFTFLSLPTPAIMEQVADEWLGGARPGATLIDLTTNAPDTVRRVGERVAAAGGHLLECPLTGGAPGAKARMLVFIAGGDAAVYERCVPLLRTIGRATFHLGPLGAGNVGKLVNSLWAFTTTWVSLEGLAICARSGIDLRTMIEMVRAAGGGNVFVNHMVEGLNQRGRPTDFALELAAKDAGLLLDLARDLAVPTPVAAEVAQALVAAKALGFGQRDFTDLVEVIERLANVELRIAPPRNPA